MSLDLDRLYNPNGKQLGTLISGLSGSGKTVATVSSLQQAIKSPDFGEFHRFIIIDPKHQTGDYDILAKPLTSLMKAQKSMRKNRVTLFYPNLEYLEEEISFIVDYMFKLSDTDNRTSFTFVLDEAASVITPTQIPESLKKLVVQGRAKNIKPVFISQRPIVNRWTDSNLSTALFFRILRTDADVLKRRWGIEFEEMADRLQNEPYSFLHFDLETTKIDLMKPLPLPKPTPKKKSRFSFLWD
jgi:DNA helicase HerA-like ATPase